MRTRLLGVFAVWLLATTAACSSTNSAGTPLTPHARLAPGSIVAASGLPGTADPGPIAAAASGLPGPAGARCAANISAQICATVTVTGGATLTGTAGTTAPMPPSADPSTTCSQVATATDGGNLGAQLPSVGGHTVTWDTSVTNFHGPGHYPGSEFHLTVDDNTYSGSEGSDVSITINPDFTTTITFTGLQSTGDTPSTVSGRIHWTCLDPT